jgi:hypothetical protein
MANPTSFQGQTIPNSAPGATEDCGTRESTHLSYLQEGGPKELEEVEDRNVSLTNQSLYCNIYSPLHSVWERFGTVSKIQCQACKSTAATCLMITCCI